MLQHYNAILSVGVRAHVRIPINITIPGGVIVHPIKFWHPGWGFDSLPLPFASAHLCSKQLQIQVAHQQSYLQKGDHGDSAASTTSRRLIALRSSKIARITRTALTILQSSVQSAAHNSTQRNNR
jgi:hypothetical protein